ncbi:PREDICTED: universal stress protein PHOS34-like [Camelina sativa]|uniref:Universal stress protein PHOS34-like n=1 Tax=Camelina sativa TaxID=90675 RepID=A0ABM1QLG9_CAMSA|nr:PREDICTED: universal stress protein PHOS34-like [Camelina sativa]
MASGSDQRVVVVGVDDSAHSYHALETALDLFFIPFKANPQFKLVVVHARPTATSFLGVAGPETVHIIPMVKQDFRPGHSTAELVKKKCAEVCSAKSVEIASSEVIEGDPRNIMLEAVERHHACVLVLGSHGYGAVKRVFLGSVSDYLAHHAHCSVMIVKKPKAKPTSTEQH